MTVSQSDQPYHVEKLDFISSIKSLLALKNQAIIPKSQEADVLTRCQYKSLAMQDACECYPGHSHPGIRIAENPNEMTREHIRINGVGQAVS